MPPAEGSAMGRYTLDSVMFHEIPRGRPAAPDVEVEDLVITGAPTPVDRLTHDFICDEMLEPAIGKARFIVEDPDVDGEVPRLAKEIFHDAAALPEHSKRMAERLHESQAAGSPAGIFMAALGQESGSPRLILMKAEHQHGVRLDRVTGASGVAFVAQHIRDLIVGSNTRVYKTAVLEHQASSDRVVGKMVDLQADGYAAFFLHAFLQCMPAQPAEALTKGFVDTVDRFVRQITLPLEDRARILAAAASYLERPDAVIRPSEFVGSYVDATHRDAFEALLPQELQGDVEFRRDPGLVRGQVGGVRLTYGLDVSISYSHEAAENDVVTFERDQDGRDIIVVRPPTDNPGAMKLSRPR